MVVSYQNSHKLSLKRQVNYNLLLHTRSMYHVAFKKTADPSWRIYIVASVKVQNSSSNSMFARVATNNLRNLPNLDLLEETHTHTLKTHKSSPEEYPISQMAITLGKIRQMMVNEAHWLWPPPLFPKLCERVSHLSASAEWSSSCSQVRRR